MIGESDVRFTAVWKQPEEEVEDERFAEEDEDDIFLILDADRPLPKAGGDRSFLWFAVVAAAVSLAVSAAMALTFRGGESLNPTNALPYADDQDFGDR